MIFKETKFKGAYVIELEPIEDERGFFARTFCREEFKKYGLNPRVVQCNISYSRHKGTLRGMHYQLAPYGEAKLITCLRGSVYEVIIDLRPSSPTYLEWLALELDARWRRAANCSLVLYAPEGCACGFQTLEDDTEVFYQMSSVYHPASARGIRWNDPAFGIEWPDAPRIISPRDQKFPDFELRKEAAVFSVSS